ncbi:MAG: hypothetical protein BGO82_06630 [Devosia sp. 67-54]|uniref:hypothetical protein n=1 Tax=unclassified Devosia TaxID=196773 RepID=UPI000967D5F9|nr:MULTISPECIES: hypothetical protein [unclassified Devosia]MBN9307578.1 hypothetical protein [Devosia sp.]OJX19947.1 MAG: hypothetical protein BGO82_06630 [Devosia sp. 67-54]
MTEAFAPAAVRRTVSRTDAWLVVALALAGVLTRYLAFALLNGDADPNRYLGALCTWDCNWYTQLAAQGYDLVRRPDGTANWAYFPLTPLLLAALHALSGWSWQLCGVVIGEITIAAACLFARPLFDGERTYRLFCVFVLIGPFAYAYGLGMSEPLFFGLSIAVFVGLRQQRYMLVALAALLLATTRVTGLFIVVPIALALAASFRRTGQGGWTRASVGAALASLAAAPVGLLAYMLYLHLHVGDALAFMHVQTAWGRGLTNPVTNIIDGLLLKAQEGHHAGYRLTMAIFALLGLGAALFLMLSRRVGMGLFVALSLVLSLLTGMQSILRFTAGLSPVTIAAADLCGRNRWSFWLSACIGGALGLVFSLLWVGGSPLMG